MTFNPSQIFSDAVAEFHKGHLDAAYELCQTITENAAPNAVCLHLMGVIQHQKGNAYLAEQWIRKSLTLKPDVAEVNFNLALSLLAQNKLNESLTYFESAIKLKPDYAASYFQIGNVYKNLEQYELAKKNYEKSLSYNPQHADSLNCLGVILCKLNDHGKSVDYFKQALDIRPNFPEALNNLGVAYLELDRPEQTREFCEKAITLRPDYTAALNNLGTAHKNQGSYTDAIQYYERALSINPNLLEARNNLGLSMMFGMSAIESAINCFQEVLKQDPQHPQALNNLGITLCHQGLFEEGILSYRKAINIKPDYTEALSNLACALRATGKIQEALKIYEEVLKQELSFAEAHNNYAMMLLSVGEFSKGLREYEWRWKTSQLKDAVRDFRRPLWQGEDLSGKTLLVYAEQGLGDTLQFCRFIPTIKRKNINILLEVPDSLARLAKTLKGVDKVIISGHDIPDFDYHCPMLNLPLALGTDINSIPSEIPYLSADANEIATFAKRMPANNRKRIGLVWSGNPRNHSFELSSIDRQRSMPPQYLEPLFKIQNIDFYSLQKDGPKTSNEFQLIDYMSECHDFADTAALVSNLDLVISVDTSVVHLAGAIGKPVWLLNRYDGCWRWLHNRNDSPWYPLLRQFRQIKFGDWEDVIKRVAKELESYSSGNNLSSPST